MQPEYHPRSGGRSHWIPVNSIPKAFWERDATIPLRGQIEHRPGATPRDPDPRVLMLDNAQLATYVSVVYPHGSNLLMAAHRMHVLDAFISAHLIPDHHVLVLGGYDAMRVAASTDGRPWYQGIRFLSRDDAVLFSLTHWDQLGVR